MQRKSQTILHQRPFLTIISRLHILGTTFIQSKTDYQPLLSEISPREMMRLSDSELWAGCPVELLYIISILNNISRSQSIPSEFTTEILPALHGFSPMKWAIRSDKPELMKTRYHLASVYKHSVAIYMSQVLCQLPHGQDIHIDTPVSLDPTILHIESISPEDTHFKGLVWPAFVIGAEARDRSQRMVIVRVFEHLWDIWRCQNVKNASDVLQNLWTRNDESITPVCWIGEIYRSGMDWIFV